MYWKWLRKIVTDFDILSITLAVFLVIIPLISSVLELLPEKLDVIRFFWALAKSLISISPTWAAVSVIALAWMRHRDGLRSRLQHCNENINKPLLVDLFISKDEEYLAEESILYSVMNGYIVAYHDIDALLIKSKDENEVKEEIERLRSLSKRLTNLNLFVSRFLGNSNLYPKRLKKRIQTHLIN